MRDDALAPAKLDDPNLKVVDVGGGTGFWWVTGKGAGVEEEGRRGDSIPDQWSGGRVAPFRMGYSIPEPRKGAAWKAGLGTQCAGLVREEERERARVDGGWGWEWLV